MFTRPHHIIRGFVHVITLTFVSPIIVALWDALTLFFQEEEVARQLLLLI